MLHGLFFPLRSPLLGRLAVFFKPSLYPSFDMIAPVNLKPPLSPPQREQPPFSPPFSQSDTCFAQLNRSVALSPDLLPTFFQEGCTPLPDPLDRFEFMPSFFLAPSGMATRFCRVNLVRISS